MASPLGWVLPATVAIVVVVLGGVAWAMDVRLGQLLREEPADVRTLVGFLGLLVGVPAAIYLAGGASPLGDESAFEVAAILYIVGLLGSTMGHRYGEAARAVRDAPLTRADSAHGDELVRVEGVARTWDRTVTAPDSGEECLVVEAGDTIVDPAVADDAGESAEYLIGAERRTVPFHVEDETGRIVVEPEDARLGFLRSRRVTGHSHRVERRVHEGEGVIVVGPVSGGRIRADSDRPLVIAHDDGSYLDRFARNVPRLDRAGPILVVLGLLGFLADAGLA